MGNIKIAAVCMHSEAGEIDKNLDRTESFVSEASSLGVDFICFPELAVTGYVINDPVSVYGHLGPDMIIERVVGMAREKDLTIITGMAELSDRERPYISQIVAGPNGLLGFYRKTHLSPQEKGRYQAGDRIEVFCHRDIIFGIQLCYEAHFPEISTVMALKGADLIFMPHASPRGTPQEKTESWLRHLTGRAFDNALFVAACNQVGKTRKGFSFPGVAIVLDPGGRIMAHHGENREKMLLADLNMDVLRETREHRMKYFIPHRRPELYKELSP